jgi:hypothetical protein
LLDIGEDFGNGEKGSRIIEERREVVVKII